MEYRDSQISERAIVSDDYALANLFSDFENGDRQAYDMLIKMLKRSEPKVEMAVRAYFAKGDGLMSELVCQAYYPFVEALCKYKFKGKSPKEITDITNSVLRELVKNAAKLSSKQSLKNQLYQRVCVRYSDYKNSDTVNSFGHQSAEKCGVVPNEALAEVKKAVAGQEEAVLGSVLGTDSEREPAPQEAKPKVSAASRKITSTSSGGSSLPKPRRHGTVSPGSDVKAAKQQVVPQPVAPSAVPETKGAVSVTEDKENAAGSAKPILPPQAQGAKEGPKLKGFPSGSHEVRNSGPYSDKLTKALARMAERDYDTYQIIVKHYFNRYSYQHLCHSLGDRPIVAVGLSLYRGLVELGRQLFGLK